MANKSVLDIEVNDEQFKAFYDMFQEYQKHLGSMPDDWRKIDQATKRAAKSFEAVTAGSAALLADIALHTKEMSESLKKATKAQKSFHKETKGSADQLKKMAGYAKSLGGHIFGIGKYLFKIGALGGGIGLLGGFGLRELGESAVRRQAQARGIGLNPGQVRAWNNDLGPYLGIGSVHSVVGAQVDANQWGSLLMALNGTGTGLTQALGMSPDRLTHRIAMAAASRWNRESSAQRGVDPFLKAQASLLGGTEALRNLAAAQKAGEFSRGWAQYKRDAAKLNYGDHTADQWQSFMRRLKNAGGLIENVLIKRLGELAGPMGRLVNSLSSDGEKLINGVLSKNNLDAIRRGMDDFAKFIGSGKFETDVKKFARALGDIADVTIAVGDWIRKHFPSSLFTNPIGKTTTSVSKLGSSLSNDALNPAWAKLHPKAAAAWRKAHPMIPMSHNGIDLNNPGNIKDASGNFAQYPTLNAGYRAMARLLQIYQTKHHLDTISGIVHRYAPASDHNNDPAYIKDLVGWTKFGANQHLNLRDPVVLSKMIAGMVRQENGIRISPKNVRIIIENKAGSNVAASANAAAY